MTRKILLGAQCLLTFLLVSAPPAQAQFTVKKIVFDGTMPYSQADLEAASGLKTGGALSKEGLQDAAARLMDTGAFDDLQAALDGPFKSVSVIFKVVPAPASHLLAAGFENFVWWTPEQFALDLHERVPLFNGTLPEAGTLQESVRQALIQMLADKQITATVSSKVLDAAPGRPMRTINYRITTPQITIASVSVEGAAGPQAAQLERLTASLRNTAYSDGTSGYSVSDRILAIFRNEGYLAASFTNLSRAVAPNGPDKFNVTITGTLQQGDIYHVAKIDWPGSSVISRDEFLAATKLHAGDVASQEAVRACLTPIDAAYRRLGYLDVIVDPHPELMPATKEVSYTVSVTPGEAYHLAAVKNNLPPAAASQFDAAWKLAPGSVYDAGYFAAFLKANIGQPYLQPYAVSYKLERDPATHLVTLNFTFLRR